MSNIEYEKIQQRKGNRADLPILDSAEIGFAEDTGQVFIGSNPDNAIYIAANVVQISPFPNAQKVVQAYLTNSTNYTAYTVNEDLTIVTETQSKALEVANFINSTNAQNFGSDAVPIATLQQNIEFVTSQNANNYNRPADFNADYNPLYGYARPSQTLLSKELDSTSAGIFLQYTIRQLFYLKVEYVLVQRNGWHRRSGVMTVVCDNNPNYTGHAGFDDNQVLFNSAIDPDFIKFDATIQNDVLSVSFVQPSTDTTKIFYRIERWNIDGVVDGAFNSMPVPANNILGANGQPLDVNGTNINQT